MNESEPQDVMDELQRMPALLAEAVQAMPVPSWTCKPAPGVFSPLEHVCHLRDLEAEAYQLRIRRIVEEDLPTLHEVDGSAWAVERQYQEQSMPEALADFAHHRSNTVQLLAEVLPRHAERKGLFGGFGIVTLAGLAQEVARHDAEHRKELQALIVACHLKT
jgi:hypothetical protein